MNTENNPLDFSRYVFVFAHPDDEIYTCAYIAELTQLGKSVDIFYVTSGDYTGPEMGPIREKEALESMSVLGVRKESIIFLRYPERELMQRVPEVAKEIFEKITQLHPDCIITHDYEGGHNGHDAVSFCTHRAAQKLEVPLFMFPAYHDWPERRLWNQFAPGREIAFTLALSDEQKALQEKVIAAHKTQESFFNLVKASTSAEFLFKREILRHISIPIDFTLPPTTPVGYEYPGSKIRFEDFKNVILTVPEL